VDPARQEALFAIDEFERTRCHGGLSKPDKALLDRLRSECYGDQVAEAWRLIGQHRKSPEDDQLLITYIFSAWHFALEAPAMLDAWSPVSDDFKQLKGYAEVLRAFFVGERMRFTGEQTTGQVERLVESLSWAIEIFDRGEREISTQSQRLRLTRKQLSQSADAQRMRFTNKICEAMLALFGRPLNPAVAALANVVLETETTIEQVKGVGRYGRRRSIGGAHSRP
jgi:hypothetical protein